MRRLRNPLSSLTLLGLLSGCYDLDQSDVFSAGFQPLDAAMMGDLSNETHHVRPLPLTVSGRAFSAYCDCSDAPHGFLIFFAGSGYGAEPALRVLSPRTRALGLDLVAFNYRDDGTPAPAVAEIEAAGAALYDLVKPAGRPIFVGGHSLGTSFALALAGSRPVQGVLLAGPDTNPVEGNDYRNLPLSWVLRFRPDDQVRRLDNEALAHAVTAPTIIFTSNRDEDAPPVFARKIDGALPAATLKRLVVFEEDTHAGYFRDLKLWQETARFFGLPMTLENGR
jgi:hypothetical protein